MPIQCSGYINRANGLVLQDLSKELAILIPTRYKSYEFVSDQEISKSAGLGSRYSDSSLHGVLFDIQMLSECDYLVCTFSSQVKHCFCVHGTCNSIYVVHVDTWMEHMPRVEPSFRVRTGHGRPGKSLNIRISFCRPGKLWNLIVGPWKLWKI